MLEEIFQLLETYFHMTPGSHIQQYQDEILFSKTDIEVRIRRRAIKHVVESRKNDSYGLLDLKNLFSDLKNMIDQDNYEIVKEEKSDSYSVLFVQNKFDNRDGVVSAVELHTVNGEIYYIKTIFYRSVTKIKKMLKKQK